MMSVERYLNGKILEGSALNHVDGQAVVGVHSREAARDCGYMSKLSIFMENKAAYRRISWVQHQCSQ